MGLEARCEVRLGRESAVAKVLLEGDRVQVRGGMRLDIPLRDLQRMSVVGGELRLPCDQGTAILVLGDAAERWADRIRNPKSRMDKLGVKAKSRVNVLGTFEPEVLEELRQRAQAVLVDGPRGAADILLLRVDSKPDLKRLKALREELSDGTLWVVWPKGKEPVREDDIRAAALPLGLVDVKVMSFSESLSALKLVVRREERASKEVKPRGSATRG